MSDANIEPSAMPRIFSNAADDVKAGDDTNGSPVGWTIVAIGRDGSILCQSPTGKRQRYQIECHLDGM